MQAARTGSGRATPEVRYARQDGLTIEAEVLRVEEMLRRPMRSKPTTPTRALFHSLLLIEEGESFHTIDFEPRLIRPGDLLIMPERTVQAYAPERVIRGPMAVFTDGFLRSCGRDLRQMAGPSDILLRAGPVVSLGEISFRQTRRAFAVLAEYTVHPPERFASEAVVAAFSLFVFTLASLPEVTAATTANRSEDPLVAQFLERLEACYAQEHRAGPYARALHTSLRTLDRHLMRARQQTARQAISARLVLEGKRLLTRRDLWIKNIAYELGFSEPQNFTRFFRIQTGLSPEAFRNSLGR